MSSTRNHFNLTTRHLHIYRLSTTKYVAITNLPTLFNLTKKTAASFPHRQKPKQKQKQRAPLSLQKQTMASLSSQQVLKEKQTRDADTITSISLTHRNLSDVRRRISLPLSFFCPNFSSLTEITIFVDFMLERIPKLGKARPCLQ